MDPDDDPREPVAPPTSVQAWAESRAAARRERDWPTADELKERIEGAGWKVIDDGIDFFLEPARPPDVVRDGRTLIGSPESVPSLAGKADAGPATCIVMAGVEDTGLDDVLAGLSGDGAPGPPLVAVIDGEATHPASRPLLETIATAVPFSPGAALAAAVRRVRGSIIVVVAADRVPRGDLIGPLSAALADPTVAIAGSDGLASDDLRRYRPAGPGSVTALGAGCYAFRRADVFRYGPFDERLHLRDSLSTWWSLVLRDAGDDAEPRRAVSLELPLADRQPRDEDAAFTRQARRDAYRIARRFAGRTDLATMPACS